MKDETCLFLVLEELFSERCQKRRQIRQKRRWICLKSLFGLSYVTHLVDQTVFHMCHIWNSFHMCYIWNIFHVCHTWNVFYMGHTCVASGMSCICVTHVTHMQDRSVCCHWRTCICVTSGLSSICVTYGMSSTPME